MSSGLVAVPDGRANLPAEAVCIAKSVVDENGDEPTQE